MKTYEETFFASSAHNAGKLVYIKRNQEMIKKSEICIFYYDNSIFYYDNKSNWKSSGTKVAFDYAVKRQKTIINVLDDE